MNLGWRPRHASGWGFPHPDPGAGPLFSENYAKTTGRTGLVVTVMMVVVIDTQPIAGLPVGGIAWAMRAGGACMASRRHQR